MQTAANPKAEPIRYEAEDYIDASGTGLEDTSDEGGGQNVAFVNAGDYLVYTISAPGIGPYSIDYRVASLGGVMVLRSVLMVKLLIHKQFPILEIGRIGRQLHHLLLIL